MTSTWSSQSRSASRCWTTASSLPTARRPRFAPTIAYRRSTLVEPTRTADRLVVDDLWVAYGGSTVVRNASLRVGQGEAVALLRRNGAGKTSTLIALAGATTARPGSVRVARVAR